MRKNNVNVTEILRKVEELEKQIYSTSFVKDVIKGDERIYDSVIKRLLENEKLFDEDTCKEKISFFMRQAKIAIAKLDIEEEIVAKASEVLARLDSEISQMATELANAKAELTDTDIDVDVAKIITELANAKTAELANAKAEIETDLAKANARADAELANAELATEQIEKWKEEAYKFNKVACQNCSESIREGFFNTQEEFEIIIKSLENFLDFALDSDIQENYDR